MSGWVISPILLLTACSPASTSRELYVGSRSNPIHATYSWGSLAATIPEPLPVRAVSAATQAALRDRGYLITLTRGTDDAARVEARDPRPDINSRWVVRAEATPDRQTRVSVARKPFGDEAESRLVMDAILQRLGR